jgi:PAS domain-containing protein
MEKILQDRRSNIPDDLRLSVLASPGRTYKRSNVLLARAHFSGTLEFLTRAWERLLGYEAHEFAGKTLRHLIALATPASARAIDAILDELNLDPVNVNVRCRDGRIKGLKLHRRFDAQERRMYIVADEIL